MMLEDIFAHYKHVVTIELSYGDELKPSPLAMLLRSETLVDVRPLISRATGRPIRPRLIKAKIEEFIKNDYNELKYAI